MDFFATGYPLWLHSWNLCFVLIVKLNVPLFWCEYCLVKALYCTPTVILHYITSSETDSFPFSKLTFFFVEVFPGGTKLSSPLLEVLNGHTLVTTYLSQLTMNTQRWSHVGVQNANYVTNVTLEGINNLNIHIICWAKYCEAKPAKIERGVTTFCGDLAGLGLTTSVWLELFGNVISGWILVVCSMIIFLVLIE